MNIIIFFGGAVVGSIITFFAMCFTVCKTPSENEYILSNQLEEVTEKHWNECRQISQYEAENKRMKEQIKQLIEKYE